MKKRVGEYKKAHSTGNDAKQSEDHHGEGGALFAGAHAEAAKSARGDADENLGDKLQEELAKDFQQGENQVFHEAQGMLEKG